MGNLKLRIKKTILKKKMEGVTVTGYYGRVITNGTKTFEDILKASTHGSTLDYREAELACKMMIDGIVENIKQGYIVDLGVLGKLYPAVNGKWETDPDDLKLADMKTKVNYKAGDDIAAAIRGAQLSWTTETETEENTVSDPDNEEEQTGEGGSGEGGQQQGGEGGGGLNGGTGTIDNGGGSGSGTGDGGDNGGGGNDNSEGDAN